MNQNNDLRFYFTTFIGFVGLSSLGMALKHQYKVFKINQDRKKAYNTQDYTPSQLKDLLNNGKENNLKNFKQSESDKDKNIIRGRVFMAGMTYTQTPLFTKTFQEFVKTPLIYRIKYDQDVFSLDDQDPKSQTYTRMNFPENAIFEKLNQFFIMDPQDKTSYAEILLNNNTDITSCLQFLGSKDHFSWKILERFFGLILMLIKYLITAIIGKENPAAQSIRGVKLGIRETEVGIKVDTPLLAYGEIIYDYASNTFRMESPIALTNNKMQYIKKINDQLSDQKWLRNMFSGIFLVCSVYLLRRFWHFQQRMNKIKKLQDVIDLLWQQAQLDSKKQCSKLNQDQVDPTQKQQQTDEQQAKEQAKEYYQQCEINQEFYSDNGQECIRCKNIYINTKKKVMEIENQIENIRANKKIN